MKMVRKTIIVIFLFLVNLTYSQISVFYGTQSYGTFSTISAAKEYISNNKPSQMIYNIYVNIPPGEYILDQTLQFTSADSGNNGKYIIYRGTDANNKPVISGGQQITGWTPHGDPSKNIWKASTIINGVNYYSRQLYVNGIRAIRSRSQDSFNLYETSTGYFSTCNDFSTWTDYRDLEIVSNMNFRSYRIPIKNVCNNILEVNPTFWEESKKPPPGTTVTQWSTPVKWIENSIQLLDEENEWYIDKDQKMLYYKPPNNVPINSLKIILPKLEKLIECKGTKFPYQNDSDDVKNLKFIDLNFCYTTWNKPSELRNQDYGNYGFATGQADLTKNTVLGLEQIPGAISFEYSDNIFFLNNSISHIGSTGLAFLVGSSNNIICSNTIKDISGSGIYLGDFENWPDPCLNTQLTNNNGPCNHDYLLLNNNVIENNLIDDVANEYFSCVGILVSFARNTEVINNTIKNFRYTGISFGWGWDRLIEHGTMNKIEKNYIDCSKQELPDGGGIYTLSSLGGLSGDNRAIIKGNYILNQKYHLGAIYLDQASSSINVEGNLIDIENSVNIPEMIDCRQNNESAPNSLNTTRAFITYLKSYHVNFKENSYNSKYKPPLPINDCSLCFFILYDNNNQFSGYGNASNNNSIKDAAGQKTIYTCNQ